MSALNSQPTNPEAFGQEMRRLRESAGLTLQDIAAETKISVRILTALEEGKFQYLPEVVFTRNFVGQYARTIGFDPERLTGWFDEAWERYKLASGAHPALQIEEVEPRRPVPWRFLLPVILAAIVVVAVVVSVLGGRRRPGMAAAPGTPMRPTARLTSAPASPVPSEAPFVPTTGVADDTHRDREQVEFTVTVRSGSECWLRYRDREGRSEQRLLDGGQAATYTLPEPVLLTLGNAAAAEVASGGKAYGELGAEGEVVHLEVTRQGVVPLNRSSAHE
jgi:cytoskeleton protein RodZ